MPSLKMIYFLIGRRGIKTKLVLLCNAKKLLRDRKTKAPRKTFSLDEIQILGTGKVGFNSRELKFFVFNSIYFRPFSFNQICRCHYFEEKVPEKKKSGTKWRQRNRSFFFSGKPPVELKKVCRQLNSSSSFVAKVLIGHLRPRSCCLCFSPLLSFVSLEPLSLLVFRSSLISSATT